MNAVSYSQENGTLKMTDSTFVTIRNMSVQGNEHTKDRIIFRESKLHEGDVIQLSQLHQEFHQSKQNLSNTTLFNDVEIFIDKWEDNNEIDLVFHVKERWYIYPIPRVILSGLSIGEWKNNFNSDPRRLTFGADLYHYNLRGRGDRLKATFFTGFQKKYGVEYSLPTIDKKQNWGASIDAFYALDKGASYKTEQNQYLAILTENQNIVEESSISIGAIHGKNIVNQQGFQVGYSSLNVSDTLFALNPDFLEGEVNRRRSLSSTISINHENRDLREYATEGNFYNLQLNYEKVLGSSQNVFWGRFKYNYYKPIAEKHNFSGSLITQTLFDQEKSFYTRLKTNRDSKNRIRGFENYRLLPEHFIGLKTEYRYNLVDKKMKKVPIVPKAFEPVWLRVKPKVFFDAGKGFTNEFLETNEIDNQFLLSYGIGLDIVSIYNMPLIFELSRNNLNQTRFNIGLGKSF